MTEQGQKQDQVETVVEPFDDEAQASEFVTRMSKKLITEDLPEPG